jgi:hypothetical protein
MTEGAYALIGAALGVIGSLATTYLNAHLTKAKPDLVAEARKKLLTEMLEDRRFEWRQFSTLCHVIGANDAITKALLLEVGARASEDGQAQWALISRHPFRGPDSN